MSIFLASFNKKKNQKNSTKKILSYKNSLYPKSIKWNDEFLCINFLSFKNEINNFYHEKNKFIICFNGMVLSDLKKKELKAKELLNLFKKKKNKLGKFLNGFYSILIYDIKLKSLTLFRDHAGIKNIFYTDNKKDFLVTNYINIFFQSNLKKFDPDESGYLEHIIHGNIVGGKTLHNTIYEIPAAHFLKYTNHKLVLREFWKNKKSSSKISFNKKIVKFDKLFNEIIRQWVPKKKKISILLSGGVDSSTISALISKITNNVDFYTAIFDKKYNYNETNLITKVSSKLKKNHRFVKINESSFGKSLINFIKKTTLPLTNYNGLVVNYICENIKKRNKSKIILTGEGSDELFSGFYRYYEIAEKYKRTKRLSDLIMSKNYFNINRFKFIKKNFIYKIPLKRIKIAKSIDEKIPIKKYLILDQKTYMPPYLDRLDQSSFLNGLEIRPVFLDKRIMEFSQTLKESEYSKLTISKNILTKIFLRKYSEKYLPKDISYPVTKKAQLMIPTSNWFYKGVLRKLIFRYLKKNSFFSKKFKLSKIINLLEDQREERQTKNDHSSFFERILSYEIWLQLMKKYKNEIE